MRFPAAVVTSACAAAVWARRTADGHRAGRRDLAAGTGAAFGYATFSFNSDACGVAGKRHSPSDPVTSS